MVEALSPSATVNGTWAVSVDAASVSFDSPLRLRRSLSLRRVTRPRRTLGMKSLASSSGLGMTI